MYFLNCSLKSPLVRLVFFMKKVAIWHDHTERDHSLTDHSFLPQYCRTSGQFDSLHCSIFVLSLFDSQHANCLNFIEPLNLEKAIGRSFCLLSIWTRNKAAYDFQGLFSIPAAGQALVATAKRWMEACVLW